MLTKAFKATMLLVDADEEKSKGTVEAVFSTMNVIDHDGDVTLPGAFSNGSKVRIMPWGHNLGSPPVGAGSIFADDREAKLKGQFFMETTAGREHFQVLKGLGDLAEWSYVFDITESDQGDFEGVNVRFLKQLRVHSVDPVFLGAGIGTRTTRLKSGLTIVEQAEGVIEDLEELVGRVKSKQALRAQDGRDLSEEQKSYLLTLAGSAKELGEAVTAALESGVKPEKVADSTLLLLKTRQLVLKYS